MTAVLLAVSHGVPAQAQPATAPASGAVPPVSAGWRFTGDAVVRVGMLILTTAASSADGDAAFNLSGRPSVSVDIVAAAAGVAPGALQGADAPAYEGSLAQRTFKVEAGQTLRLEWLVVSRDARFVDRAFVVVDGKVEMLAPDAAEAAGNARAVASSGPALTTWRRTFAKAQQVTLTLGIVDTGDHAGVSSLRVQGVAVERNGSGRSGAR